MPVPVVGAGEAGASLTGNVPQSSLAARASGRGRPQGVDPLAAQVMIGGALEDLGYSVEARWTFRGWVGLPVLGYMLKQVPRHVPEHMPGYMPGYVPRNRQPGP